MLRQSKLLGWCGNIAAKIASSFDPSGDCILNVDDRLLWRLAVAHATGKVGNGRKKTAAFFQREAARRRPDIQGGSLRGPRGVDGRGCV